MIHSPLCLDADVYAGNKIRIYVEAFAPEGAAASVNPTTARVAVTDVNGVTVSLTEAISYPPGEASVYIEAYWDIPDDQRGGVYTVTIDTGGNLIGATQRYIKVRARTLAVVPV